MPVFLSISALQHGDIPDAVCMVVTDLTEQKRNEEILAEEKLTTQILHQAAEIFVLCDRKAALSVQVSRQRGSSAKAQSFSYLTRHFTSSIPTGLHLPFSPQ